MDALERRVETVERNREKGETDPDDVEAYRTRSEYDIRGNLSKVTDSLTRPAFEYEYDLANTALRTDSLDAGVQAIVFDAAGNEVERCDSKGARTLRTYDELNRPIQMWAKDKKSGPGEPNRPLTLREFLVYGDSLEATFRNNEDRPFEMDAYEKNLLGKLYIHYDEAGKALVRRIRLQGERPDERAASTQRQGCPRTAADQLDFAGRNPLESREGALLEPADAYETTFQYDALNRQTKLTYPEDVDGERKSLNLKYNRAGALRTGVAGAWRDRADVCGSNRVQRATTANVSRLWKRDDHAVHLRAEDVPTAEAAHH